MTPAGALLLNPSLDEEKSTSYAVLRIMAERKGWSSIEVANLISLPTRDTKLLAAAPLRRSDLIKARPRIESLLARCNEVIFAWGVSLLPGDAGRLQREQIQWVLACAIRHGHQEAWMMGGVTRHPSRWRQFVGPQRALVEGRTTAERLEQALVRRPIEMQHPPASGELSVVSGRVFSGTGAKEAGTA